MKQKIDVSSIWRFVSSFFDFLDERTREIWEFAWEGFAYMSNSMYKAASRFVVSSAPQGSYTSPTEDFYEVPINIVDAKPTLLDSTRYNSRSIIIPRKVIFSAPTGSGALQVRNDMIEIDQADYSYIRDIALDQYVVIKVSDPDIKTKYYRVLDTMGPIEIGSRYYDSYVIKLADADLSYIPVKSKFTFYITSGRSYKIDDYVIDLSYLSSNINDEDEGGIIAGVRFNKDEHYTFSDGYIEFVQDYIGSGLISNGVSLYGKDVPVMETNLYNSFGTLVGIPDWKMYHHDNISGKIAINSLIRALQNPSSTQEYERALSVYYGLPVAPEDSKVLGLFESYDYTILAIDNGMSQVTLQASASDPLHPFIQPGTKFLIDGTEDLVNIPYDDVESNVMNRVSGVITLNDTSDLRIGDKLNIKLNNRTVLSQVHKAPYTDSTIRGYHWTAGGEFDHIASVVHEKSLSSGNSEYPEMMVDNTTSLNGYFHFKSCDKPTGTFSEYVDFRICDHVDSGDVPIYNDYINLEIGETATPSTGYVNIPWPTHKYLLLKFEETGTLYKCYLDAPIDTSFTTGDSVKKYQVLSRCVTVCDNDIFANWNEFNGFKRNNGIDLNSNFLELIYIIPYAKFGEYFSHSA